MTSVTMDSGINGEDDDEEEDEAMSMASSQQLQTDSQIEDSLLTAASRNANPSQEPTNYLAEQFSFSQRLAHFTPGNIMQPAFAKAVQSACIFEAGTRVYAADTQRDPDLKMMFYDTYQEVLQELDDTYIDDPSRDKLKFMVGGRQDSRSEPMDGDKISRRFTEIRREINKHFTPKLPKNISTLPSGTDLNEAWDNLRNVLTENHWKKDGKPPPEYWLFTGVKPVYLFLTVQVFRTSPHVNPWVAKLQSGKSKAELKREKGEKRKAQVDSLNEDVLKRRDQAAENQNIKASSRQLSSKAYAKKIELDARIAENQSIKDELQMLRENPDLWPPAQLKEMKRAAVMKFMKRKPLDDIIVDTAVAHRSPTVSEDAQSEAIV